MLDADNASTHQHGRTASLVNTCVQYYTGQDWGVSMAMFYLDAALGNERATCICLKYLLILFSEQRRELLKDRGEASSWI